jgi:hypothetical protein
MVKFPLAGVLAIKVPDFDERVPIHTHSIFKHAFVNTFPAWIPEDPIPLIVALDHPSAVFILFVIVKYQTSLSVRATFAKPTLILQVSIWIIELALTFV